MSRKQWLVFAGLIFTALTGAIILSLIQREVCSEMAELMQTQSNYNILGGCRWDLAGQPMDLTGK